MPGYFTDDQARSIILDTYGQACSESTAVAESLYSAEELAAGPRPGF